MPTSPQQGKPTIAQAVAGYVSLKHQWQPEEYHIEEKGTTKDGQRWYVWVVHRDDLKATHPGGGKSISLEIDRETHRIVLELHFQ